MKKTIQNQMPPGTPRKLRSWLKHAAAGLILAMLAMANSTIAGPVDRVGHDVSAGYFQVNRFPDFVGDDNLNAEVIPLVTVNDFRTNAYNRGDYRFQVGEYLDDDLANGVMIAAVAQNGRNNYGSNSMQTACVAPYTSFGGWEVAVFASPVIPENTANRGEDNVNVSAAYFPFESFIGGVANNSANSGVLSNFWGSAGLVWGTHFIDSLATNGPNGIAYLDLLSFGIDSRRDGVLLVNGAKNEANFALSKAETNGTWIIFSKDNRANGTTYEQDPVCFVFVPKSNTNLVSGRFLGDGTPQIFSGATPAFTVTNIATGRWILQVAGHSPADGVLVISPEGGDPYNADNIVTYEPTADGLGWEIQARDLPGQGLQGRADEPICSFVFLPAERPGLTLSPSKNLITTESGGAAFLWAKLGGYPKPTADVSFTLSSSDTTEGIVSPTSMTLTPADWGVPQMFIVSGVDDVLADGLQAYKINASPLSSADANYNGFVAASASAVNQDNEPGASTDVASITTTEAGGTATFTVWLNTPPTADVKLALSSSDTTEATVSPALLTFTPSDYYNPQIVTVTGVDDGVADGNIAYSIVLAPMQSTDAVYNNSNPADVAGVNIDNDIPGIVIPPDPLTVSEPNTKATFGVFLSSEPTANVTVSFVSDNPAEGTVTPSVTFTPANWSIPQTVTVTAVDDLLDDGTIAYKIITSATSADPAYAAINPDDVDVSTLDNEAVLTLPFGPVVYGIGDLPIVLDGWASIVDPDTEVYNSGSLTVTLTGGGISSDRLLVRNVGAGPGEVGVAGSAVSFGGVTVGSVAGGTGTTPLTVTLNSAASREAVQAVLRAVAYQNVSASTPASSRALSVVLADGLGGTATASKDVTVQMARVYQFQQGLDIGFGPYTDAADTQIHQNFPDQSFPEGYSTAGLWIDWMNGSLLGQPQVMMRFTNLFGTGPGQIPPGASIISAQLIIDVNDAGHGMRLNRMLGEWEEWSTYNSFGADGISLDDIEATSTTNAFLCDINGSTDTGTGFRAIGVTRDLRAWVDGTNNYGWVMSPWVRTTDGNGIGFSPSEATNIWDRPRLEVEWLAPGASKAQFAEGKDGYTGAVDTQIRLTGPDTDYSASTSLATDAITGTGPTPQQVLLRFDNIIGSGPGQVPAGATILSATVEFTTVTSDSQGDGGEFYAMLKPWEATSTWNSLTDGVTPDGVEALSTPTGSLGPSDTSLPPLPPTMHTVALTADVQAWANGTRPNYGWAILPWPNGGDGWGLCSSDNANPDWRPVLTVFYAPSIHLGTPVLSGGKVVFPFSGVANQTYTVQRQGSLGGGWSNIGPATADATGAGSFTDNAPLPNAAFYRLTMP